MKKFKILYLILIIFSAIALDCSAINKADTGIVHLTVKLWDAEPNEQLGAYVATKFPARQFISSNEYDMFTSEKTANDVFKFTIKFKKRNGLKGRTLILSALNDESLIDTTGVSSSPIKYTLLEHYYIEDGDEILLDVRKSPAYQKGRSAVNNFQLLFKGTGAVKYSARYQIDSIRHSFDLAKDLVNPDSSYNRTNLQIRNIKKLLPLVDDFAGKLSIEALQELKLHTIYFIKFQESLLLRNFLKKNYRNATHLIRDRMITDFEKTDTLLWSLFSEKALLSSFDFFEAQNDKYRTMAYMSNWDLVNKDDMISFIKNIKRPVIREQIALNSLKQNIGQIDNLGKYFIAVEPLVKSKEGKSELLAISKIRNGQPAYNFNLQDTTGKMVQLSEFRGKVVMLDFWYTGCTNCILYNQNVLSKVEEQFRADTNVIFISISIDRNKEVWKKSIRGGNYTSKHIINLYTGGTGTANDVIKFYEVLSYPRPLLIDRKQRIFQMGKSLRNEKVLVNAIKAAQ